MANAAGGADRAEALPGMEAAEEPAGGAGVGARARAAAKPAKLLRWSHRRARRGAGAAAGVGGVCAAAGAGGFLGGAVAPGGLHALLAGWGAAAARAGEAAVKCLNTERRGFMLGPLQRVQVGWKRAALGFWGGWLAGGRAGQGQPWLLYGAGNSVLLYGWGVLRHGEEWGPSAGAGWL